MHGGRGAVRRGSTLGRVLKEEYKGRKGQREGIKEITERRDRDVLRVEGAGIIT